MLLSLKNNKSNSAKRVVILALLFGFLIFLSIFNNFEKVQLVNIEGTSFEKAVVMEVLQENEESQESRQRLKVKVLSGQYKGRIIEATSFYGYLYGAKCNVNTKVILNMSTSGGSYYASVYSYYREPIIYGFIGVFIFLLWIIGGKKGIKSAVALMFTFVCIIYLFIPMLYKGYSPFLSAVIVIILITIVSLYLIDGITKKSISAMIGTIIGVIIAGICAAGFGYVAKISGYNVSEVEELVFVANNTELKVGGILFSAILIASLGAVMDVSMSISSTLTEIYNHNKNIGRVELFKSGINVGRDMMGTMSNTLILAFTGGSINTLILNYAYALKHNQIINMYEIGIEIMQGVSGSIAIILSVPLVSIISSYFLTYGRKKSLRSKINLDSILEYN